jgi:hypothetical protein
MLSAIAQHVEKMRDVFPDSLHTPPPPPRQTTRSPSPPTTTPSRPPRSRNARPPTTSHHTTRIRARRSRRLPRPKRRHALPPRSLLHTRVARVPRRHRRLIAHSPTSTQHSSLVPQQPFPPSLLSFPLLPPLDTLRHRRFREVHHERVHVQPVEKCSEAFAEASEGLVHELEVHEVGFEVGHAVR